MEQLLFSITDFNPKKTTQAHTKKSHHHQQQQQKQGIVGVALTLRFEPPSHPFSSHLGHGPRPPPPLHAASWHTAARVFFNFLKPRTVCLRLKWSSSSGFSSPKPRGSPPPLRGRKPAFELCGRVPLALLASDNGTGSQ